MWLLVTWFHIQIYNDVTFHIWNTNRYVHTSHYRICSISVLLMRITFHSKVATNQNKDTYMAVVVVTTAIVYDPSTGFHLPCKFLKRKFIDHYSEMQRRSFVHITGVRMYRNGHKWQTISRRIGIRIIDAENTLFYSQLCTYTNIS